MSNVNYRSQFNYSFAGQPVRLLMKVNIGASGAPTIAPSTGMGISSIIRNSAGNYTIKLSNSFATMQGIKVISNSGASAPAAPLVNIASDAVATIASPQVIIQCRNLSGAATDPASGEILYVEIDLNRSSTGN